MRRNRGQAQVSSGDGVPESGPIQEIVAAQPDVILLPNEPFAFDAGHAGRIGELLRETPAARNDCIVNIDGSLITWHGTRLARALRELPAVLERCNKG